MYEDTVEKEGEKFEKINQLGIFKKENEIPIETFNKMVKLGTYTLS